MAVASAVADTADRRARRDLRRRIIGLHRPTSRALQPRARAGAVPGAPLGRTTSRRRSCCRRTAEQISEVVQLANRAARPRRAARRRHRPHRRRRAAAARDPRRREAHEPDPRDRPRRAHGHGRPGHQHAEAERGAAPARLHLSGQPGVVPVLARRRAHRHERLVADRRALRPHARSRHLVRDRAADRRDHPGRRRRRQEDPQVVVRLPARSSSSWATRARSASSPRRRSSWSSARRRSSRRSGCSAPTTTPGGRRASSCARASRRSPAWCCSTSGRSRTCVGTTRRTSRSPTGCRPSSRSRCTATATRCAPAAKRDACGSRKASGGEYVGDEISQLDWSARHDRYATPLHGRTPNGQVAPMCWHCEDAGDPVPEGAGDPRALARDRRPTWSSAIDDVRRLGHVRATRTGRTSRGATSSARSTSASGSSSSTTRRWAAWVDAKREIARASHRGRRLDLRLPRLLPRAGEVDLVPLELGGGLRRDEDDQADARPEQRHEPRQVRARLGLRGRLTMDGFTLAAQTPPDAKRDHRHRRDALRARLRGRPGADDRARAASRTSRPGTRTAWSTRAGSTSTGCRTTSPTSVVSGEELLAEIEAEEG